MQRRFHAPAAKTQHQRIGSNIPPDVAKLIEGRTVRIEPKRYFARRWKAMLPLVKDRVTRCSDETFTLKPGFFKEFTFKLSEVINAKNEAQRREFRPSDWICFVLSCLAHPGDAAQEPIIYPSGEWERVRLPPGLTRSPNSKSAASSPALGLSILFQLDEFDIPFLEIGISGEALDVFDELFGPRGSHSIDKQRAVHKQAKETWAFLSKCIATRLGIEPIGAGRPITNIPQVAAFLRDHYGFKPPQMAEVLCKADQCKKVGKHTAECRDRLRKAADLHWKHEQEKYAALARTALQTR